MNNDFPLFAERLASLRASASMTQAEAAKAVGVARNAWTQWESGDRVPRNATVLGRICQLFDVTADYLLGVTVESPIARSVQRSVSETSRFDDAKRLIQLRTERGWTIKETADRVGVQPSTWSAWEKGTRGIFLAKHAYMVCAAFDVSIEWFMGNDSEQNHFSSQKILSLLLGKGEE